MVVTVNGELYVDVSIVQRAKVPKLFVNRLLLSKLVYWIVLAGMSGSVPLQRYWPDGSSIGVLVELMPPHSVDQAGVSATSLPVRFNMVCRLSILINVGQFNFKYEVSTPNVEFP